MWTFFALFVTWRGYVGVLGQTNTLTANRGRWPISIIVSTKFTLYPILYYSSTWSDINESIPSRTVKIYLDETFFGVILPKQVLKQNVQFLNER